MNIISNIHLKFNYLSEYYFEYSLKNLFIKWLFYLKYSLKDIYLLNIILQIFIRLLNEV